MVPVRCVLALWCLIIIYSASPCLAEFQQVHDGRRMNLNEQVRITYTATRGSTWCRIALCSRHLCGVVSLRGFLNEKFNTLGYLTYSTSTNTVNGPVAKTWVNGYNNMHAFEAGKNYTFVVWRESSRLMNVWAENNPEFKISVMINPDSDILKLSSDSGTVSIITGTDDKPYGYYLAPGATVAVRFETVKTGAHYLGMCGKTSCAVVNLLGANLIRGMGYETRETFGNTLSEYNSYSGVVVDNGPRGFAETSSYTFIVNRPSAHIVEVRLEEDPGNYATVNISKEMDYLQVESNCAIVTMFLNSNMTHHGMT